MKLTVAVRSLSTVPARATSRLGAGVAVGTALAGYAAFESEYYLLLGGERALTDVAMRSPLLMEGSKTIAGEKGTVSERSFVMVSFINRAEHGGLRHS